MKKIFLVCLIAYLFLSCKKTESAPESEFYTVSALVLDIDSGVPIANAQVDCGQLYSPGSIFSGEYYDSLLSDQGGKANFTFKKLAAYRFTGTRAKKTGYIPTGRVRFFIEAYHNKDRSDTLNLVKPSFVNLNIHQLLPYQNSDTFYVKGSGNIYIPNAQNDVYGFSSIYKGKANSFDTSISFMNQYKINNPKIFVMWEIVRNGTSLIASGSDSINLIQYGQKIFQINY